MRIVRMLDASFGDSTATVIHVMHMDLLPWTFVLAVVTTSAGANNARRTHTHTTCSIECSFVLLSIFTSWCFEATMQI